MGWITRRLGYGLWGTVDGDLPDTPPQVTISGSSTFAVAIDQTFPNNVVVIAPIRVITSDTFTGTTTGSSHITSQTFKSFAIQVKGTGAIATSWNVILEGSIDNTNYTPIMTHTESLGELILWAGANSYPSVAYRVRVTALVLGSATNIIVTVLSTS